ncbi:hypothetical protein ACP4I1_36465 [Streptomyces sp. WG4]|uniref:hypothetical protein n=1 Tax=Streptomyces sp. WG4 TaxID=3417649 RepID=UPI003CE86A99
MLLADVVEQQRGQEQAEQGGDDGDADDDEGDVAEGGPEVGVLEEPGVVVQADEGGIADALPRRQV